MLREEITNYIKSKSWEYKEVPGDNGDQFLLRQCPFCKDTGYTHFYISSETGQYICHKCGEKGSLYTLKKHCGDIMPIKGFGDLLPEESPEESTDLMEKVELAHQNLMGNVARLKDILKSRKFSMDAVYHFKLGLEPSPVGDWLWYPYWHKGIVRNVKMRLLPPAEKAFRRWRGGESLLFNEDALEKEEYNDIIITEGESDAIALWSKGFRNVVGVTVGAKGIKPKWIDQLDKFERIFFVYDTDIAGNKGAATFATRLGIERCWNIRLPNDTKDVNQYFIDGGTREGFESFIAKAEKFDVESVRSLGRVLQDMLINLYHSERGEGGLAFPWDNVNRLSGKMQAGDLWVIASKPKVGKTTFSFNIAMHLAKQDIPVLFWSLEMRPERMMPRIIALHLHKDSQEVSNFEDITKTYTELREYPFYFAYGYRKLSWDYISDTIRSSCRRYGIRFVVFDNLHFLGRSKDHMVQEVSIMSQNFKLLAEELGIPILLIARPRKTKGMMEVDDLAWSGDIEADADAVILLHREEKKVEGMITQEGVFEPETLVRVNRVRYSGGGATQLICVDKEARFDNV